MRCSRRYKDGVPETLHDGVALHVVLLVEPLSQGPVQVPALVVYRVVVGLQTLPSLQRNLQKIKRG